MEYEYCSCNVNVNSARATGVLVYRDWRLMIFLIVSYMRNMLFFASHESRRSCKTEIRDGSDSDLSRICLPRGPADFCTRICVGKTRYLIRDGSVSDPRRVRFDFTHEVLSFLYRPCCTKPQSFDPRRIRLGSVRVYGFARPWKIMHYWQIMKFWLSLSPPIIVEWFKLEQI